MTACSGGTNSSSPLPATGTSDQSAAVSPAGTTLPVTPESASASAFSVVQTALAGGTYNSTVNVKLSKAPTAGDVLVLFFETNKTSSFPYSGQVTFPASLSGSQWSYDGSTGGTTAILHHVVQAGESGSYTLNVGGTGSGYADYMTAEISGANASNPVNAGVAHSVTAGTASYTFGSAGLTPTVAGTFPVAFFSPHASGRTWSAITSGWTIAARNADFSEMLATGPVQTGTTAVNAAATLSSSTGYAGAADLVLLNPSGSSVPVGPTTAPTSAPTIAPTSVPSSSPGGAYTYHGCQVFTANDWFTTDLTVGDPGGYVPTSVDPNSATVISTFINHFGTMTGGTGSSMWYYNDGQNENIATSSTPMVSWSSCAYGCHPSGGSQPWTQGSFIYEGAEYSPSTTCAGSVDCHGLSMTGPTNYPSGSAPCMDYESYNSAGTLDQSGRFNVEFGGAYNLKQPFNGHGYGGGPTMAGIPYMGTTDWGEDASLSSINHPIAIWLPNGSPTGTNDDSGGAWVGAAQGSAGNCTSTNGCSTAWLFAGDRLRLNQSKFSCSSINRSVYPQSYVVCEQMAHYGLVVADYSGNSRFIGLQFGTTTTGAHTWNVSSDLTPGLFKSGLNLNDFDLMKRCGGNKKGPLGSGSWGACSGP